MMTQESCVTGCGSAAAQGGKAQPFRDYCFLLEATPLRGGAASLMKSSVGRAEPYRTVLRQSR
jgi:hypothetical protein